jgi:hypothetical protein
LKTDFNVSTESDKQKTFFCNWKLKTEEENDLILGDGRLGELHVRLVKCLLNGAKRGNHQLTIKKFQCILLGIRNFCKLNSFTIALALLP